MRLFPCYKCGDRHAVEYDRYIKKLYTLQLDEIREQIDQKGSNSVRNLFYTDFVLPMMKAKNKYEAEKVSSNIGRMLNKKAKQKMHGKSTDDMVQRTMELSRRKGWVDKKYATFIPYTFKP